MSSISNFAAKEGRKRVKPEPSSDDEFDSKTYVLNTPPLKKRGRPSSTNASPANAIPAPFTPDPSITSARDGRVFCTVLERLIMSCPAELRNEVSKKFGVNPQHLHVAWANLVKRRSIAALRKEFAADISK